jgi:outer membrane immunogenic protein
VKHFVSAVAFSALVLATAPAFAATPTGGRVEALIGYDVAKASGFKDSGFLYGLGAGYDFAVSPSVSLGGDIEASDSTVKEDVGGFDVTAGRDLYAGGRVSFPVGDAANLYLKAGYTNARIKAEGIDSANLDGFRIGGGGQYAFSGKAYVGGEYRYSNYQDGFRRHQVALTVGTHF